MMANARAEFWSIYRQALPVLGISLGGGLFAGVVLDSLVDAVADVPGLLVMVPVFLATRGNVYGALGGRIASGLHQGLIEPTLGYNERLLNAVVASLINGVGISIVIGVLTLGVRTLLGWGPAALGQLVVIMFITGLLTSVVLIAGLLMLMFVGFNRGVRSR
jgi:mgtE-like transporter